MTRPGTGIPASAHRAGAPDAPVAATAAPGAAPLPEPPGPFPAAAGPFPYRLIATELDGTLLRSDGSVSARTRAALAAAGAAGAVHIVVTGRAVPWVRPVLHDLGYTGLAVCGQGAQLYDAGAHRLVTSVTLDRRLAALAVDRIEAETGPLALAAWRDGVAGEVLVEPGYRVPPGYAGLSGTSCGDRDELFAAPLSKVYLQHPGLGADAFAGVARRAAGELVKVTMAGEGLVGLLPLGLTKSTGLSLAARRLKVRPAQAIAFGAMPDDIPLFSWAGRGIAMSGAHPDVLAVADEVTASNDEDGIAVTLERLLA